MASARPASRRWVWEQYDQSVGPTPSSAPAANAAVVARPRQQKGAGDHHRLHTALLLRRPGRGREAGGGRAYRNLCAVGAKPLAITNCLNFGNPQRPEIMGQFVAASKAWPKPAARSTSRRERQREPLQ